MKSDQEPAIMTLIAEISKLRAEKGGIGRTIEEASPVGSSSSNGVIEREESKVLRSRYEYWSVNWKLGGKGKFQTSVQSGIGWLNMLRAY